MIFNAAAVFGGTVQSLEAVAPAIGCLQRLVLRRSLEAWGSRTVW